MGDLPKGDYFLLFEKIKVTNIKHSVIHHAKGGLQKAFQAFLEF